MRKMLLVIALLAGAHAHADEASKRAKIGKLIVVQGLEQMIQQQIDQSLAGISTLGDKAFDSVAGDATGKDPEVMSRLRAVHNKFLTDAANIFSAKEVVDFWSVNYGKDLTEADIDKILAYYMSPTGKKDIAASKAAMTALGQTFSVESEKRVLQLLDRFKADMDAAANTQK